MEASNQTNPLKINEIIYSNGALRVTSDSMHTFDDFDVFLLVFLLRAIAGYQRRKHTKSEITCIENDHNLTADFYAKIKRFMNPKTESKRLISDYGIYI